MGKSRMVDEYSKLFVVLPLCLRYDNETGEKFFFAPSSSLGSPIRSGYPYADKQVRNYLLGGLKSYVRVLQAAHAFMWALFDKTTELLRDLRAKSPDGQVSWVATELRLQMTDLKRREAFYNAVVTSAKNVRPDSYHRSKQTKLTSLDRVQILPRYRREFSDRRAERGQRN